MEFYVFPHCPKAEKQLITFSDCGRLFAFPAVPTKQKCRMTILDSGAYGLFQSGRKITERYMQKLSEHYKKYYTDNVICVAPDVVCNPSITIRNFDRWKKLGLFEHISPVIQPDCKERVCRSLYEYQIDYYVKNHGTKTMLFSNWLTADAAIALGLPDILRYARKKGVEYIHMLGAGWNIYDLSRWDTIDGINSCDSIAYYSHGAEKRFWSDDPAENARRIICLIKK